MVVFDVAFKRETYFDGAFGVLVKVKYFFFYFLKFYFIIIVFAGTGEEYNRTLDAVFMKIKL